MTKEQQAAKYIGGLKYPIQEHVILHDLFSVDEANKKHWRSRGYKVEFHISDAQHRLESQKVTQEFNRAPQRLTDHLLVNQCCCISTSNNNHYNCEDQGESLRQAWS